MTDTAAEHNEGKLLSQIAEGDQNAFRQLFHQWHQILAGYVYRITESRELTEEIVQDVFLKIWTIRDTLSNVRNFKSFLLVVSRNQAFFILKKLSKERKLQQSWRKENATSLSIEVNSTSNEWMSVIDQAIESLPPRRKEVWLLIKRGQLSYKEVAAKLGISKESVKTHLKLATQSISDFIRQHSDKLFIAFAAFLKIF